MDDMAALIKSISYLLWPICLLLIVFIFREEIRNLLQSFIQRHDDEIGEKLRENKAVIPLQQQSKPHGLKTVEQLVVDARKNKNSGKYSIILDENKDKYKTVTPDGKMDWFKKELFDATIEDIAVDQLAEKQREKFYWLIQTSEPVKSDSSNFTSLPITGYLKNYMIMLDNPNTEPSRMLHYIKSERNVSWSETKNHLHCNYGYVLTSGSMGASLKALEELKFVKINGQGDNKLLQIIDSSLVNYREEVRYEKK